MRAALGADRWRLIRQLLAESLLLAGAGTGAGVLLALVERRIADGRPSRQRLPIARLDEVGLGPGVLLFAVVVAGASALLFGIVPALTAAGASLTDALERRRPRPAPPAAAARARRLSSSKSRWRWCCSSAQDCWCAVSGR